MKRLLSLAALAGALVAGCTDTGGNGNGGGGNGARKTFPKAAGWEPAPGAVAKSADQIDDLGEKEAQSLRLNGLDTWITVQYRPEKWDADPANKDTRRIRVHLYLFQIDAGAARTFQELHSGHSITDVGEKACAAPDCITFLRGNTVVRLMPMGSWKTGEAAKPTIEVAKAMDGWIQNK